MNTCTRVSLAEVPVRGAVWLAVAVLCTGGLASGQEKVPADTVRGVIRFTGSPLVLPDLVKAGDKSVKDADVCSVATVPNESLVVNSAGGGIANVFVYLAKAPTGAATAAVPKDPVVFDQKGCRFLPHALVVRAGQPVKVLSDDPIAHNTHTYPVRNQGFNQVIKASDRVGIQLTYAMPERLPVEVKCDLHPWMKAYHLPVDHPYAAVTDAQGKFEIKGLPAGEHEFVVWQERAGYLERKQKVKTGQAVELSFGAAKFARYDGPAPAKVLLTQQP